MDGSKNIYFIDELYLEQEYSSPKLTFLEFILALLTELIKLIIHVN